MREEVPERFWSKVQRTEDCWPWKASTDGRGYGHFMLPTGTSQGRLVKAHRFAWELTFGSIPNGLCVLHRCDNPSCVRPDHLFLGTLGDNARDMVAKGRFVMPKQPHGEQHSQARLTESNVHLIRRTYELRNMTMQVLARQYKVGLTTVFDVLHRKTWTHF